MTTGTGCCAGSGVKAPWNPSPEEGAVLDGAEAYLRRGLDLKRWWDRTFATGGFAHKFPLTVSSEPPDASFGFFDVAEVDGRPMPIMGNYQSMFYDQPKASASDRTRAARWMRDQVRQFALRYFMRVSHFTLPQAFVPREHREPIPVWLRPVSWCPEEDPRQIGFGFSQLFFKEPVGGRIGAFPETDRYAIVDLREIGTRFEWILPKVQIFDFKFAVQPFGPGTPTLTLPLEEGSYLVMNRDFVIDEEEPSPDLLGRYGFGYSFIKNPETGLFAFGPGEFDAAIEIIQFSVDRSGRIQSEAIFVVNRPTRVANVSLNPFQWGYTAADLLTFGTSRIFLAPFKRAMDRVPGSRASFDPVRLYISAANLLTAGEAGRELCVSIEQLEKDFLTIHFQQHHQTLIGSLETWRLIPDWLASEDELPAWVVNGRRGA